MFEKVNPSHPDKIADRIAGAVVDLAYAKTENPKIAVEVLIGHGTCLVISETSVHIPGEEVVAAVERIGGKDNMCEVSYRESSQDEFLAANQENGIHCGDNGIFLGMPVTSEELKMAKIAEDIYAKYPTDGKYIYDEATDRLIICQSKARTEDLAELYPNAEINPIGDWSGGTFVDCGATNRKLGSDMGLSITGGGLHGKDLSKADVSANIYAWLKAQETGKPVELCCAIGDDTISGIPYDEVVKVAGEYIKKIGGFEKFAEWGLVR